MHRNLVVVLFCVSVFPLAAAEPILWDVAVEQDDPAARETLATLDVWSAYRDEGGRWRYRVAASEHEAFLFSRFALQVSPIGVPPAFMAPASEYRDADTVRAVLAALEEEYPSRAKRYVVGTTIEGREIVAMKISAEPGKNIAGKYDFLFTGMHHAREWISVEVTLRFVEFLLEQYDHNPRIRQIVDAAEIWVIPMLNEDGYRYTWTKDRYWRKNRRHNADNSYGVDLNRNYDADWGGEGSSKKGSSDVYCGTSPFSEPETDAVRNLLDPKNGFMDDPAGFIDFHSYSQLILYPYGNTEEHSPREKELAAIAERMSDLIMAETGVAYEPIKSSELYVATGASADWFHLAYDFRNSLIIELRPGGDELNGFSLPTEQIKETARENAVAALYFIEATMAESADIETDSNGDGVIDYLEGCGETLCEMLYDERSEEPVGDGDPSPDEDVEKEIADGNDTEDREGTPDDETAVITDADTVFRRAVSGGCSIVLF